MARGCRVQPAGWRTPRRAGRAAVPGSPRGWKGGGHRGAQLHDLRAAVTLWATRYGQRAWLRQLEPPAGRAMEDALLHTIAQLDGTPFPSAARVASGWLRERLPPAGRGGRDA